MRLLPLLAFIIAALTTGCGSDNESDVMPLIVENSFEGLHQDDGLPLSFEIDRTFGAEEEPAIEILQGVRSASVDADGNVYILDGQNRIVSFDADGSFRWEMAEQGEGPGELNRSWGMVQGPDGLLYVNNQTSTRIDIYDQDGDHVDEIRPESFGHQRFSLTGFPNDSTAAGTVFERGTLGTRIVVLDTGAEWTVRNEVVIDQTGDLDIPEGMSGSPSVELFEDVLAVTNVLRYEVALLDLSGDTLRIIRRDVQDFTRPGFHADDNMISMRMFSSTSTPFVLPTGHRMITARWPANVSDPDAVTSAAMAGNPPEIETINTVDIYDDEWNLLYSVQGDEEEDLALGSPVTVDEEGFLYASRSTPWPQLVRYRIRSMSE